MIKNLIIIGAGSFAKLLDFYIREYSECSVVAFSVNEEYIDSYRKFCGRPTVPLETLEGSFPPSQYDVIMGVGYSGMNRLREKLFKQCKEKGYHVASYIHPTVVVPKDTRLGEGNIILEKTLIQPFVTIGDGNLIWYDVKIAHDDTIGDFNTLAGSTSLSGSVTVRNNCFLGNACVVLNNITVSDLTLVGAGARVARSSDPYDVIVPARSVTLEGKRSIDYI